MRRELRRGTAGRVIFMGYPAAEICAHRDTGADSAADTETRELIPRRAQRHGSRFRGGHRDMGADSMAADE